MPKNTIFDSPTRTVCDNLDKFGYAHRRNQLFSWTEHNRSRNANKGLRRSRKAVVVTSVSRGTGLSTTYEL
jgi:hypothetical protein